MFTISLRFCSYFFCTVPSVPFRWKEGCEKKVGINPHKTHVKNGGEAKGKVSTSVCWQSGHCDTLSLWNFLIWRLKGNFGWQMQFLALIVEPSRCSYLNQSKTLGPSHKTRRKQFFSFFFFCRMSVVWPESGRK